MIITYESISCNNLTQQVPIKMLKVLKTKGILLLSPSQSMCPALNVNLFIIKHKKLWKYQETESLLGT